MKAAEENHVEIMKLLLDHRADIKISNRKGCTALSFAVSPSMGRDVATGTLKLLLEQGADPLHKDAFGLNAKERARREKRAEALKVLQEFKKKKVNE